MCVKPNKLEVSYNEIKTLENSNLIVNFIESTFSGSKILLQKMMLSRLKSNIPGRVINYVKRIFKFL